MARIHLFEFEDLSWFPSFLRNYGTDFLQFLSNKLKIYRSIIPLLSRAIQHDGTNRIVDLGSGGGGGWLWLHNELLKERPDLTLVLTDYYPNKSAFTYTSGLLDNVEYIDQPVNALDVPSHLKGVRTMFLLLHHFKPRDAKSILQNALDNGSTIAIFEGQERDLPSIVGMLVSPISVLLSTPFIRPFKWGRILFTYLIPIVPLFVLWDGLVSALRTYSVPEMQALVDDLEHSESYDWEIGKVKSGPGKILYLLGLPKRS